MRVSSGREEVRWRWVCEGNVKGRLCRVVIERVI